MVIYQAMYGTYKIYARPLTMFMEEVDHVKYPNVTQKYRFEKVELVDAQEKSCVSQGVETLGTLKEVETLGTSKEVEISGTTKVDESCFTQKADVSSATEATDPSEIPLDPKILEFLDARTYDEKLTILSSIHHRLTDDMIDIMSTATDIEVKPGSIEERYEEFKSCLITMQHFECNRLH